MATKARSDQGIEFNKPTQARAMGTFKKILQTSLKILEQESIDALNTNRISAESGINISTLYHYFPNKDAIIYALYQDWIDRIRAIGDKHRQTLKPNTNPKDYYQKLILDLLNIEGYSSMAAVELERAVKIRKELRSYDEKMDQMWIQVHSEDLATFLGNELKQPLNVEPAFVLVTIWGAMSIAAGLPGKFKKTIATRAADMIAALVRNRK